MCRTGLKLIKRKSTNCLQIENLFWLYVKIFSCLRKNSKHSIYSQLLAKHSINTIVKYNKLSVIVIRDCIINLLAKLHVIYETFWYTKWWNNYTLCTISISQYKFHLSSSSIIIFGEKKRVPSWTYGTDYYNPHKCNHILLHHESSAMIRQIYLFIYYKVLCCYSVGYSILLPFLN